MLKKADRAVRKKYFRNLNLLFVKEFFLISQYISIYAKFWIQNFNIPGPNHVVDIV